MGVDSGHAGCDGAGSVSGLGKQRRWTADGSRDILRLTALFHARRGRAFLSSLSVREGRNYQFDFLRPTHSLYGYYNRMVESYQKVITPREGLIAELQAQVLDPEIKWKTLDEARNRAEWERGRRKRENDRVREEEEEAKAFAAVDWNDFVVVETIEFTQTDMELDLPPPMSVDRLQGMSMAEKRMAAMVMEETGAGPAGGDVGQTETAMQQELQVEEEEVRLQRVKAEQEQVRAREVQRAAMESRGMKIKKDYVPKGECGGWNGPEERSTDGIRYTKRSGRLTVQVPKLWPAHPGERAVRAHPDRIARPQVERAETQPRPPARAAPDAPDRRGRLGLVAQPRERADGLVWG